MVGTCMAHTRVCDSLATGANECEQVLLGAVEVVADRWLLDNLAVPVELGTVVDEGPELAMPRLLWKWGIY